MFRVMGKSESEIRLAQDGRWFHAGDPFTNEKVIRFFHRAIRKDERGEYYLYNRYSGCEEHVYFQVDDTAYFVLDLALDPAASRFRVLLNTETIELLDLRTLEEDSRGVLYCRVLGGDRARFSRDAIAVLADYAKEDERGIYFEEGGGRFYVNGPGTR